LALALLALTIFLAAALLSYDPADPPGKLVFPQSVHIQNVCGRWGALTSHWLLTSLGLGAYYLWISLAVLDATLLARRAISDPLLRIVGWLISLVALTALVAMALPGLAPGPVIGSGGYLGAAGRGVLEFNFGRVGSYILGVSVLLAGLLLCSDYLVLALAALVFRGPVLGLVRGLLFVLAAYGKRFGLAVTQRRTSDIASAAENANTVAVRIGGRVVEEVAAEEDDAEDAAEEEEPADDEADVEVTTPTAAEPAPPAEAPRKSLAAMFFGRKSKTEAERQEVIEELEAATVPVDQGDYKLPSCDLLLPGEPFCYDEQEKEVRRRAKVLEKTFSNFGLNVKVVEIQTGPVIAQYEVELEAGLRLSKVTALADDVAIALRVPSVRIVAPIPGKNTVGVEVPNTQRQLVRMREVIEEAAGKAQKMRIPLYLGKDVAGNPMVADLTSLPHLLIAGRTGTGKSVCLNTIIVSMLMTRRPDEVRMLMIDPKMVELSPYKSLPHLMHPVVTDMRKAEAILGWAVEKMEERYQLLARAGVRHVSVYNQLGEEELMERIRPESDEERKLIPLQMPYIVVVADEMADLMMTAAKEVEQHIIRLAQKSRAVGIHLVLATQKPTVDVITGLIKSNLPARISFQVASRTDSRVVLDEMGADKLLGNGDMLFLWPGTSTLIRGQGTYLGDDEINKVIDAVATTEPQFVKELVQLKTADQQAATAGGSEMSSRDEHYDAAVEVVIREGRGSVSLLQRALGIGYGRAARLIDFMAEDGVVGTYNGSQAREVIITLEQWEAKKRGGSLPAAKGAPVAPTAALTPTPPRSKAAKITLAPRPARPADTTDDAEDAAEYDAEDDRDEVTAREDEEDFDADAEADDVAEDEAHDEAEDDLDPPPEDEADDDMHQADEDEQRPPRRRSGNRRRRWNAESA